jgi:hypothetical protein
MASFGSFAPEPTGAAPARLVTASRAAAVLLAATLAAWSPAPARAHDVDVTSVARVFLEQIGERRYTLSIVDAKVPPIADPDAVLPVRCDVLAASAVAARIPAGFAFECTTPLTLADELSLPWPLAGVVVLARWSDGTEASAFFRGDGRAVPVRLTELGAGAASRRALARRYFVLGGEHILFGVDHLLFVAGLLLLVRGVVPLIKTITAFTVAHSITLGASVLGYVPVERAPVEAAIALSIVLLAREIAGGRRGHTHLVHRRPWLVAFVFGLLHGLGFAGALGELGLRSADVPLALLFFNVGVEAGQLAFVLALLAAGRAAGKRAARGLPRLEPALGYALGALAMSWFFDRLPALWGA